jgi:DNA-binding winged helix-turn-helix (wHTH) protein/TolB-like protein/Tfp pilus assembly protein PilF
MARDFYEFGPFRLDPHGRRLLRDGLPVVLTPKVFDTLLVLVEHHGRSLSRSELIAKIWPETVVGEHNLNQCIAVLRKVLDDNPRQPNYIATLPGRGYSFVAEVSQNGKTADSQAQLAPESEQPSRVSSAPPAGASEPVGFHATSNGVFKKWGYAAALLAILLLIGVLPLASRLRSTYFAATPRSVSVLPFDDLGLASTESERRYLANGLTQELTAELARLQGLKVVVGRFSAPAVSVSAALAALDPISTGRSLHVESLLKGSVRQSGAQYRIAVQLIRSRDGQELWSGVYTADVSDIPSVEEQIVHHTADTLRVPWSASLDEQWARRHIENPEAHDLYLQARYLWSKRDADSLRRSVELLQQAIAKDPSYARAYAGLADSYGVMAVNGQMPTAKSVPLAREAAAKALQLDPTLAEPHATLGLLKFEFDWDFAGAQEEFSRCLALNPGYATGHHWAGLNFIAMGKFESADAELRKAQELDPLSPMISEGLFENYYAWHRFDDAIQTIRALIARNPIEYAPFSWAIGASYVAKGMYPEAEVIYRDLTERSPEDINFMRLAYLQALEGNRAAARATLERIEHKPDHMVGPDSFAKVHLALGDTDTAIAYLQQEYREHSPSVTNMRDDPELAPLHNDPRFQQLLHDILTKNELTNASNR